MNNRIPRTAKLRSLLLSSFLLLSLFALGCPPPQTVDPGSDGGGGGNETGDDAGAPVVEGELTAAMAAIEDGYITDTFVLDARDTLNPDGRVLLYAWEVEVVDAGDECDGSIDEPTGPIAVFTPACRGVHHVELTVSFLDDAASESKAIESFSVDNRLPVLSGLAPEEVFLPGTDVTISASVDDADGDPTTCSAQLAADNAGDPTGLVIPGGESSDCTFTILTPLRVDTWKVQVVAHDGFGDSLPMTVELRAGNDPPVIDDLSVDATEVAYTCVDDVCTAATVRVTVEATDDTDDFEDLVITLDPATGSTPPDGVVVTSTPVAGMHGAFDVVVSRPDLGPIAGTYTFTASVLEVTAETPTAVTQDIAFEVLNADPVIDTVTAPAVPHAYAAGTFTATLTAAATTSDPEANALTTAVELLSCPRAAVGEVACGGAGLTITETATDGQLVLELSTADLANLAGEYTFRVTTTDADGGSVFEDVVAIVQNNAPALAPGFTSPVQQAYIGSVHQASTPLYIDLDGDPLTATLTATCPDDSSKSLPGSCDTDQGLSIAAGVFQVSGPATGLLGDYVIAGTITDGAATTTLNQTFTVANTAPTLTRTSLETQSCDHETTGTAVTTASGCSYNYAGDTADSNGDPLTVTAFMEVDSGYEAIGSGFDGVAVAAGGDVSFNFDLETTYATLKASFSGQPDLQVRVSDPFGASFDSTMSPKLDNRLPVLNFKAFHNKAGTAVPPTLHNDQQRLGAARDSYTYFCYMGDCPSPPPVYEFSIATAATDPDGDPLEVSFSLSCSTPAFVGASGSPSTLRSLPAGGRIQFQIPGRLGQCSSSDRYRAWALYTTPEYSIGCDMDGKASVLSDGISPTHFGADLSFRAPVDSSPADFNCN